MISVMPCYTAGSLHSLQSDIERLSHRLSSSLSGPEHRKPDELQLLSAQADRLVRQSITLHHSDPCQDHGHNSWQWLVAEPVGTTVGSLQHRIASLEAALADSQRCACSGL